MRRRILLAGLIWAAGGFVAIEFLFHPFGLIPTDLGTPAKIAFVGLSSLPLLSLLRAAGHIARRSQRARLVNDAFKLPGAPALATSVFRPRVEIVPRGIPGSLVEAANAVQDMFRRTAGLVTETESMPVDSSDQAMFAYAKRKASLTRGLTFLTHDVQQAVFWYIVADRLKAIQALEAAKLAQAELEKQHHNYHSLFNPETLRRVDLSKPTAGENYFSRFFQPLMLAFSENRFQTSTGIDGEDPQHALMAHLVHLNDGRVVAARIDLVHCQEADPLRLKRLLPVEAPTGIGHARERGETRMKNARDSARAILIVTEPGAQALGEVFESRHKPLERYAKAGIEIDYWTPDLEDVEREHCFLWQKPGRITARA